MASYGQVAAAVRRQKEAHPEQFCRNPRCLWRTSSGKACPKHPVLSPPVERPCRGYLRGSDCGDKQGRDHCFNCARHLDPVTCECPKDCGNRGDEHDDRVSNEDQDREAS